MAWKNRNSTKNSTKSKKTPRIITPNARLENTTIRIKRKYQRQRQKGCLKNVNKRTANWLKKAGYIETDNLETVHYNNVSLNEPLQLLTIITIHDLMN